MQKPKSDNLKLEEGEPTPLELLEIALNTTLREYGEFYLSEMDELLEGLIYIRFKLEPMFIKDKKQLINIYNRFRDGGFTSLNTRNITSNSDITIRFLTVVYSRWMSYIADKLGLNVNSFINYYANTLANIFTSFENMPNIFSDTLGQSLTHQQWHEMLVQAPVFLTIFSLKLIDSDYIDQVRDFTILAANRQDSFEFTQEG